MSLHPIDVDRLVDETFVAGVEHHRSVGSTNDLAKSRASEGPGRLPLLIVADEQTAGRGRGSNRWWTGDGSLALSLLVDGRRMGIDTGRSPLAALATAVAVVETAAPLLPDHTVGIHWPNDVMVAGRKLSGILVEVLAGRLHVVGIGLNTNNSMNDAPDELRHRATTMLDLTGRRVDHTEVLSSLLGNIDRMLGRLATTPEHVAGRADELCLQHGQMLTIRSGSRTTTGRFEAIAPDGALVLTTPGGRQTFHSGVLGPHSAD